MRTASTAASPWSCPLRIAGCRCCPLRRFTVSAGSAPLKFVEGGLVVGNLRIPLDDRGNLLLKYRGPSRSHRRFSAANVISSEARLRHGLPPIYPPEAFAGKWVLVGLTAPGLLDLKASPMGGVYPGVEVHATLLDNLLQGDFLRTLPGWALWAWALVLAAAMAAAVLFSPRLSVTLAAFGLAALLCLSLAVLAFWQRPVGRPGPAGDRPGPELRAGHGLQLCHRGPPEALHPPHVRPVHVRDGHQPPAGAPGKAEAGGRTPPGHPVFLRPGRLHHHLRAPGRRDRGGPAQRLPVRHDRDHPGGGGHGG